jgi:predicted nuclease with TOPRIM domain
MSSLVQYPLWGAPETAEDKKQVASLKSKLDQANAERDALQTKLDQANAEIERLKGELEQAQSPNAVEGSEP